MKKNVINDYITMYQFPTEVPHFSLNICAVFNGDEFILIDTGYETHMEELNNELDLSKCKLVFFTHQHPDHTFGAKLLTDVEIVGHKDYQIGFDEVMEVFGVTDWVIDGTAPTRFAEDGEVLRFGPHTFTFIHHPVHTSSSMLIDLNGEYLFTGDELLSQTNGADIISLFFIKEDLKDNAFDDLISLSEGKTIIPGHGNVRNTELQEYIQRRNHYISLVKNGIAFENLEENGFKTEIFEHLHNMNLYRHSLTK